MFRKYLVPVLLVVQVLVFLLLASVFVRQPSASAAMSRTTGSRRKRKPLRTASMSGATPRSLSVAGSSPLRRVLIRKASLS